ncbi:MAG TPA: MdtA/MuxA family multidrug efflux RND transporter periplasmic adaptor subunit [Bryobacteraceae bacterium]|nr:MdtA/MuxA family multidrug efflux RND transporter periplasmic adaptor subunit [Bryobacteraceae bacterium]
MNEKLSLPTLPAESTPQPPGKSKRGWIWLVVVAVAVAGAYHYWPKGADASGGASPPGASGGRSGRGAGLAPVVAAKVRRGNIGVYVTGLGTVTPINTITIKSRVDGQLMKVNYQEGELVHEGDPLIEIDTRPYQVQLDMAEGQLMRDQALLDNAKVDLDRYQTLLQQNAIPEQTLATQKSLVAQLTGTVTSDRSQIDSARLNLTYCHITAPITGRVGLRLVDSGNIIHASDAGGLLVITQVQPISVVFSIVEDKLPEVLRRWHAGQSLPVEIWDRADEHKIGTGTLKTVDNQIDPTTGMIRLRADLPNADESLFPDQFVNVRLLVQEKQGVTLVPSAAVQRTTSTTYVYLVKPDSTVTVRNLVEGVSEGEDTEVTDGLAPGDVVVMAGVDRLNEGAKVAVQFAAEGGRGQGRGNAPALGGPGAGPGNPEGPKGGRRGRGRGRGAEGQAQ